MEDGLTLFFKTDETREKQSVMRQAFLSMCQQFVRKALVESSVLEQLQLAPVKWVGEESLKA